MIYRSLRYIHLLAGLFAVSMLLMYGVSAVQMAHSNWLPAHSTVREWQAGLAPGLAGARDVARKLYGQGVRGELGTVTMTPAGWSFVIGRPGTEHQVAYERTTGEAHIKTTASGFPGMLNRLHHAAGFWHESTLMKLWAAMVAVASLALLLMGATGIWMWFLRRQDRVIGVLLLLGNLTFALIVLALLRQAGP